MRAPKLILLLAALCSGMVPAVRAGEAELIAILKSNAPAAEKAITCKRLAIYGGKDAVPVLAPLLADEKLASWARIALEAIPDSAAETALLDATGKLRGKLLIGVINTLGVRRDPVAVAALIEKLKDADADVASAAAVALGRIGGDPAASALAPMLANAPAGVRLAVAEGCILCAEKFIAAGKSTQAVKLYESVRAANVTKQKTIEATRGVILARGSAGIPLLVAQLKSEDRDFFNIALRTAREIPGRGMAKALLAEFDQSAPDRQSGLLMALADRGDAEVLPAALKAVKTGTTKQRVMAIGVLERFGNASALPVLLAVAAEDDAGLSQAAKLALIRLPGAEVNAGVVAMLKDPEPKARRLALDLMTQRRVTGAVPSLLRAAQDSDEQVRLASFKAMGDLAGIAELPAILDLLVKSQSPAEIEATEGAVTAICARSAKSATGNVVIVKAVYGDLPNGPLADVTRKVADIVKGGAMTVTASNSDFGDPVSGLLKKLRVDYKVNGQANSKMVAENETITFIITSTASIISPACADAVFAALPKAPTNSKLALLRVLRSMGGARALDAVRAATNDANAEIKDTALRALCDWSNAEALPELAQLAKTSTNPTFKILALRGYIRLAGQQDVSTEQKLATLKDALTLAERPEEKRLALAALGTIRTVEALALVTPYLADPVLKEEACQSAVSIATGIKPPYPPQVLDTIQVVTQKTTNNQLLKTANALLKQTEK